MGSELQILVSAALLLAPIPSAYAEPGIEPSLFGQNQTYAATELARARVPIRVPPAALRRYDANVILLELESRPLYQPAIPSLSLIESGSFKMALRNDGFGHYALVSPWLRGLGVGGEARKGGGVFRLSWPTSD